VSMEGRIVKSILLDQANSVHTIDLKDVPSGVYMLDTFIGGNSVGKRRITKL